ncbi:MAG TPA: glycosyltransferase family 1 protein [Candidatus Baltobacteraceae bacterium]|nr:glycosyltransferase family 1 protein [Candidatus Baltobacteraceae bacterium]
MKIGVDAFNLGADRRGMGRLVRQTLERLRSFKDVDVVHVVRKPEAGALTPRDLRGLRLDAVWYPWNGMRFAPYAPAIVTINDPFAFTYPHPNLVARWREQAPIRRAIRRADCIFTISQWGASELQRLFAVRLERVRAVLPAVDPFWQPASPAAASPYMLFVGGPDARKNAAMLFEAYDAAFAGGGPELIAAGALNAGDEERFAAMRTPRRRVRPTDEELRALYSGALAVLVPSLAEGFGLPVVEAMACGAPVLASDASALPEAADGAALLLAPQDPRAWTRALARIASDETLRGDLRERGFARVRRMDADAPATALIESVRRLREDAR